MSSEEEPELTVEYVGHHRLTKAWSPHAADYIYFLHSTTYRVVTVKFPHFDGARERGDREWAERQAAHYGIEIEDDDDDES